jgi:hypothetical protein
MRWPLFSRSVSDETRDILGQLTFNDGEFPEDAVKRALLCKESIIPELLKILKSAKKDAKKLAKQDDYMAHIYAMFLLAFFREKKAYPLLADFFSLPGELTHDLTGDVVTEDLGRILASVSCGDPCLMKKLIENRKVNEYVRCAALNGIVVLVAVGELPREEAMDYFQTLFREKLERKTSCIWGSLICDCLDMHPAEVFKDIQRAFKEGWVEPHYVTFEEVQAEMRSDREKTMQELRDNGRFRLVEDPAKEMEWWACFHDEEEDNGPYSPYDDDLQIDPELLPKPIIREGPRIGRNDPCPCGSGKKYKKCCLDREREIPDESGNRSGNIGQISKQGH